MHVEQTYKGNYHLLANIDGTERKFVISKNKEEFASIEQIGLANLTEEHLKMMAEKYFILRKRKVRIGGEAEAYIDRTYRCYRSCDDEQHLFK